MNSKEKWATFSLAGIFALRMLGLFLIMPVFALYAEEELTDVTPLLVGTVIGIYGLTQAIFQIPLGILSDHIGRKPVIIGGLLLFTTGSIIAAIANNSIEWIIIGRALQGSGAIAAAIMALAADLTRESRRTTVMGIIGISIGLSFTIALIIGPLLNSSIGISGLFFITAIMGLCGIFITLFIVPTPIESKIYRDTGSIPEQFIEVLSNYNLLYLYWGIFTLHMVMTAMFLVLPLILRNIGGIEIDSHWLIYLPVVITAMVLIIPFIVLAEVYNIIKFVFLIGITILSISLIGIALVTFSLEWLIIWILLFFTAFNLLEAILPSLVSKIAPVYSKGTVMGIYSTFQFLGAFLGGIIGGLIQKQFNNSSLLLFCSALVLFWLLVTSNIRKPQQVSNYLLRLTPELAKLESTKRNISLINGVIEIHIKDEIAYLKVDKQRLNFKELKVWEAPTS